MRKRLMFFAALVVASLGLASFAAADTSGAITFESDQGYAPGDINHQPSTSTNPWLKSGAYDAKVVSTARFDFGQALQISNAVTSGSFGDQTFSPSVAPAGDAPASALQHFDASFQIATVNATVQPDLSISVSPDNGQGARVSYLRFQDQADGVHVFFDDIRNSKNFKEKDVATLSRTSAHTIEFSIDFKGASSDSAKVFIDGKLTVSGTTWAGYYQLANEPVPTVKTMLFRSSSTPMNGVYPQYPSNAGNGFLIDNLTLASS
jgi:hypothetical protein